eukprot:TRINITY_DN2205_c0_g1_i3.p1 TRINITY_DN2205_c0_g1~~TRINITY_DN2205_c0_g1_i3.p1  ORF type:complete len:218 (-),score=29.48 TRINITY_DN2205_c0_g1_i3:276-929(-)
MDVEFWASRVNATKHLTAMQAARLSSETHLSLDDSEGDDDVRACFPCPFCYVDIEVHVLCTHLQEEHCFDVKNAVCPVCAANMGKDMIGHFTVQHSHLVKQRRKSQRTGIWTNSSGMFGKQMRELSSFHITASANGRGNAPDTAPDPLLSPFLCGLLLPDPIINQDANSSMGTSSASISLDEKSTEPSTSNGDQEQGSEERRQRAEFFQQIIMSTIF